VSLATLLAEIAAIMREHQLVLPADLALLFKALITLEGLGTRLVPHFRLVDHVTPFVRRLLAERWAPRSVGGRLSGTAREWGRAVRAAPRLLESLARRFSDDGVALRFEVREIEAFGYRMERSVDRATIGLVTAALIVGSSLLVAASVAGDSLAMRVFGALGVVIAFANSLWLLATMRRAHR
jgi:ubiquinone biosynthesis protein